MRFSLSRRSRKTAPVAETASPDQETPSAFHGIFGQAGAAPAAPAPTPGNAIPESISPAGKSHNDSESPATIMVFGLPIPPIAVLADYVRLIGNIAFTRPIDTVFGSPFTARGIGKSSPHVYLKMALAEFADVVGALNTDEKTRSNLAIASQFHKIYQALPSISIEDAISDVWSLPRFLAEHHDVQLKPDAQGILNTAFVEFRDQAMLWGDPLLWLARCDVALLLPKIDYRLHMDYSVGAEGPGLWSLMDGWHLEHWGAWSRGHSCRLRLRVPAGAGKLILICSKLRQELRFTALLNGIPVDTTVQSGKTQDRIVIDVPQAGDVACDRDVTAVIRIRNVKSPKALGINEDTRLLAIGLRAIRLEGPDSQKSPIPAIATHPTINLEQQLIQGGFAVMPGGVDDLPTDAAIDIAALFDRLGECDLTGKPNILLLGRYTRALGMRMKRELPSAALVVCVVSSESAPLDGDTKIPSLPDEQDPQTTLLVTDRLGADTDDVLCQGFDVVCVLGIQGLDEAQALIDLATCAVGSGGVILGQEQSPAAVRAAMGLLAKESHDRDLAATIGGRGWRAHPLPLGLA